MPVCKWCQSNNNFQCLYEGLLSNQPCEVHPQTGRVQLLTEKRENNQ